MTTQPAPKHTWLYHRNRLFAWASFLLLFGASFLFPNTFTTVLWFIPALLINYLIWITYRAVHPRRMWFRRMIPTRPQIHYPEVLFPSRDGLTLSAWHLPGVNNTAIILVHGLNASKYAMLEFGLPLQSAGYHVFLIDLRAHGGSDGDTCGLGISEANDVLGAMDYLFSLPEIEHIGALGVSLGGGAVLRAAARSPKIEAVVLDGIGASNLDDLGGAPQTLRGKIYYPINWLMFKLDEYMSGIKLGEGIKIAFQRLASRPVLLISTGKRHERKFAAMLHQSAPPSVELWEIPQATHAAGMYFEPREYPARVIRFFNRAFAK